MKKSICLVMMMLLIATGSLFAAASADAESAPFEERYQDMSWDEIVAEAEGQELYWYMWGGNDAANQYVTGYLAGRMKEEYGVTVNQVPVTGPQTFMNAILGEKEAGKDSGSSVDMMWINGANFYKMKNADALFGPYTSMLPNIQYVNWEDASLNMDYGFPTDDHESPWGTTQVVVAYDSVKNPNPPKDIDAFLAWIMDNPGRFTYPIVDDFTGQDFVKHVLYAVSGGTAPFEEFSQETWDKYSPLLWDKLNEIKPYLWREGETYPESRPALESLFGNGEIDFVVAYGPTTPKNLIKTGQFPETTRTYVWDSGTIGGANYLAISYNSSAKAAAMVLCNMAMEPEAQYVRALPDSWGALPLNDMATVSADLKAKFDAIPRAESVVSSAVLNAHMLPELNSEYLIRMIAGWKTYVLGD
ncbi:MAG: ABC transporter substrate-binding protein [Bacteroidetes bacterium]|nr:ABC transporter substrate-binding protein [Bacteroidota bacterium]